MVLKIVVWTNLCIIRNLFSFEKRQVFKCGKYQSKSLSKKNNRIDNIDIIMSVINSIISLKWL